MFAVKVGITDGNATEYFWLTDFSQTGDSFSAVIDNEPENVKTVKIGQVYYFAKAQIVDWTYFDRTAHKMMGNFTLCALLTDEPPSEGVAMKQQYGLDCEEAPKNEIRKKAAGAQGH